MKNKTTNTVPSSAQPEVNIHTNSNTRISNSTSKKLPWFARGLLSMLSRLQLGQLRLQTPTGDIHEFGQANSELHGSLVIKDWRAAKLILAQGDIGFAESLRLDWVYSPDLLNLFRLALQNQQALQTAIHGRWWALLLRRFGHLWLNNNSRRGSQRNISAHYDLGNDFYRLWLDQSMTYSAAWFTATDDAQPAQDLQTAQLAKYQRILDLLQAQPGQRILEIGCGWGGFAEYAASRGMHIHGITLSPAQLEFAQQRMQAGGWASQVTLELRDYRDLPGQTGIGQQDHSDQNHAHQYDHIVSIEMLEAVGESHWPSYFRILKQCLKPEGGIVIQSIDIADNFYTHYRSSTDFIQQYIFPGGMLPCPAVMQSQVQAAGLQVKQSLGFGLDYARTLQLWHQAFMGQLDQIQALGFDAAFIRLWEMYLKYCEAGFIEGRTDVKLWLLKH